MAAGLSDAVLDERLAQFQSISGLDDDEKCKLILQQNDWNVQRAVEVLFEERDFNDAGLPRPTAPEHVPDTAGSSYAAASSAGSSRNAAAHAFESAAAPPDSRPTLPGPRSVGGTGAAPPTATGAHAARLGIFSEGRPLLTWGPRPLQLLVNSVWALVLVLGHRAISFLQMLIFGPQAAERRAANPQAAASRFLLNFEQSYGRSHPEFFQGSYNQAVQLAQRTSRLLMVYLHCEDHGDTAAFCRNTLASPQFREYVATNNVLFWAGDVREVEATKVSERLQVVTYPFLAVLDQSSTPMRIATLEGNLSPQAIIDSTQSFMERIRQAMAAAQAAREQRDLERRLREDQEREYQAARQADEAQLRAAADRRAAEERQQSELRAEAERARAETERARVEAERAEKAQQEAAELRKRQAIAKAAALPAEPPAGTPNVTTIAFRLPDGKRISRRFGVDDTVQVLYDYLESREVTQMPNLRLHTSMPRRVFEPSTQTLRAAGLVPNAVLMVDEHVADDGDSVASPAASR